MPSIIWRYTHCLNLNGLGCNVFFIIRPKAPDGPQGGWKFPFSFTIQKWGFVCYESSRGRHNMHTPLWFNVWLGVDNFSVQMQKYVLCVFLSLRQAGDPRHNFNQDWRGYQWMHASRWIIHIAAYSLGCLLDSTCAKRPLLKTHHEQSPDKNKSIAKMETVKSPEGVHATWPDVSFSNINTFETCEC